MEDKCQDRNQEINILDRSCKIQATKYKMVDRYQKLLRNSYWPHSSKRTRQNTAEKDKWFFCKPRECVFLNPDKVFTHRSHLKASCVPGWNWYVLLGNTFLLWCQGSWWVGGVGTGSRQPINTDTRGPPQTTTIHHHPLSTTLHEKVNRRSFERAACAPETSAELCKQILQQSKWTFWGQTYCSLARN